MAIAIFLVVFIKTNYQYGFTDLAQLDERLLVEFNYWKYHCVILNGYLSLICASLITIKYSMNDMNISA